MCREFGMPAADGGMIEVRRPCFAVQGGQVGVHAVGSSVDFAVIEQLNLREGALNLSDRA